MSQEIIEELLKDYTVKLKSSKNQRNGYFGWVGGKYDPKQAEKEKEEYENEYYGLINQIVELGGIIQPSKYYSEYYGLKIKTSQQVADKIAKLEMVEAVVG